MTHASSATMYRLTRLSIFERWLAIVQPVRHFGFHQIVQHLPPTSVSLGLVLQQVVHVYSAVCSDLMMRDLVGIQQLNEELPRNAEHVSRFDSRERRLALNNRNRFPRLEIGYQL